jgi:hypothetical protein
MIGDAAPAEKQWTGTSREECQRMVDNSLKRDPVVRFMVEKMEEVQARTFGLFSTAKVSCPSAPVTE